jgi:hypothetical protein
MGALLQLVDDTPDDQIATEPQRRAGVMRRPPRTPQLLRRPIDQPGNLTIKRRADPDFEAGPSGRRLHRDRRTARQSAGEPKCRGLEVS